MDNQAFILLAARMLSGEASERDIKDLEKLIDKDKVYKEKLDLLKAHWENRHDINTDIEAALEKIILRIEQDSNNNGTATITMPAEKLRGRQFRLLFFRAAAVLLVSVSIIYIIYKSTKQNLPATAVAAPVPSDWQLKQTDKEKSQHSREDGTTVILNADNGLSSHTGFRIQPRGI